MIASNASQLLGGGKKKKEVTSAGQQRAAETGFLYNTCTERSWWNLSGYEACGASFFVKSLPRF